MSRIGGSSQAVVFDIEARVGSVLGTLIALPLVVQETLGERTIDIVSHHRNKTIKNAAGGAGSRNRQAFIATRLFRYSNKLPRTIADVKGESFAALDPETVPFGDPKLLHLAEYGGTVSGKLMAIPFKRQFTSVREKYAKNSWLNTESFGPGGAFGISKTGLIFQRVKGRKGVGAASRLVGFVTKRRQQRAYLGFYATWAAVEPKAKDKLDRDMDRALTAAGRVTLASEIALNRAARSAASAAFKAVRDRDPRAFAEARRAGRDAARQVRADALNKR